MKLTSHSTHYLELQSILENKQIKTVFQPIVSLRDGSVLGYEALSRGPTDSCMHNPEMLFKTAKECDALWDLELLCRTTALEAAYSHKTNIKLFLNVNPDIIHDDKFKKGFTKEYLKGFNIDPENIIFEITEKNAIDDIVGFKNTINNYKNQNYKIAIDDAGAGYSGLNLISDINPHYIKLDMRLIRDIDKDGLKSALVKSMHEFSKLANTFLIAEGIETKSELNTLVDIGVQYGQGYFIQKPKDTLLPIDASVLQILSEMNTRKHNIYGNRISSLYIGNLSKTTKTVAPDELSRSVYEMFLTNNSLPGLCVVQDDEIIGIVTRSGIHSKMSGLYGFNLNQKKPISVIMQTEFLSVDYQTPVDMVSHLAMSRPDERLYDFIAITNESKLTGIVTVKNLLEKTIELEVINTKHQNPLSGLPGNLIIEQYLTNYILSEEALCVLYFDIDNFKSYNDVYGFENGDSIIKLLSNIIQRYIPKDEFVGHIGGDDFIALISDNNIEFICECINREFDKGVKQYYNSYDLAKGYITTRNRHGVCENFPILSLSIAGVTNKNNQFAEIYELSIFVGELKKKCKQIAGSAYVIN